MRRHLVLLTATCLLALPAAADVSSGIAAYQAGDFAAARTAFQNAANAGDPDAQTRLAILYLRGEGVEKDLAAGAHLLQEAAQADYVPAIMNLAKMHYRGVGMKQDKAKAAFWYGKAAELGEPIAMYFLSLLHLNGDGVPRDPERGAELTRQAALRGQIDAQYQLGNLYEDGLGVTKDIAEAYHWYFLARQQGFAPATGAAEAIAKQLDDTTLRSAEQRAVKFVPIAPQSTNASN